jgi:sulfite reductase alpha subunit-like flavoprotein
VQLPLPLASLIMRFNKTKSIFFSRTTMTTTTTIDDAPVFTAQLVGSKRITPPTSREEVLHMVFRMPDDVFHADPGQSIHVLAPGQFGNKYHTRLYTIADPAEQRGDSKQFTLCVKRCHYVDQFNGQEYRGVASNYLCDLKPGDSIKFTGPVGLAFPVPADRRADMLMIGMGTGIAPFRAFIRHIYEKLGGWEGKVRLFFGARTGLEMLYMNDENNDLANYYDQKTFKAFQAVSPRPGFAAPAAIDKAIEQNAAEVLQMLKAPNTHVFIAGVEIMEPSVEKALTAVAGSDAEWKKIKGQLVATGRWHELLY